MAYQFPADIQQSITAYVTNGLFSERRASSARSDAPLSSTARRLGPRFNEASRISPTEERSLPTNRTESFAAFTKSPRHHEPHGSPFCRDRAEP